MDRELGAVIARATAVDPAARYDSAAILAQDIQRYLDCKQTARQISEFLVSILDGANPDAGSGEIPTSTLVEQAHGRIDIELAGQPAVQAELHGVLAGVQGVLGNPALALSSYQRAIELERTQGRPLLLAELLGELARLHRRSYSVAEAEAPARESLRLYEENAPSSSTELARATTTLGAVVTVRRFRARPCGKNPVNAHSRVHRATRLNVRVQIRSSVPSSRPVP